MTSEWSDEIVVVDLADEPELSEELAHLSERIGGLAAEGGHVPSVVLNFGAVSYMNSSNIAQLLRVKRQLAEAERALRVCAMQDEVWSVIKITGLDKVFVVAPDPMTALASIQLEGPAGEGAG